MADWSNEYCTFNEVKAKAGNNYNSADLTEDDMIGFAKQARAFINSVCRFDFGDVYGDLTEATKGILTEAQSSLAGMYSISFDMKNFTSRVEAQTMLDVLRDGAFRCISLLRDMKTKKFVEKDG